MKSGVWRLILEMWFASPIGAKFSFAVTTALFVGSTVIRVATPFFFSKLATSFDSPDVLTSAVLSYAGLFLLLRICDECQFASYVVFEQALQRTISLAVISRYFSLPFSVVANKSPSERAIAVDRGISGLRSTLFNGLFSIAPLLIEALILLLVLASHVSMNLALFALLLLSVFVIVTYVLSEKTRELQQVWFATAAGNYKILSECLRAFETIRSFAQVPWAQSRYSIATDRFVKEVMASLRPGLLLGVVQGSLLFALVAGLNAIVLSSGPHATQTLPIVIIVNGLLMQMITPLLQLSGAYRSFIQGYAATKQLMELFTVEQVAVKFEHEFDPEVDGIYIPRLVVNLKGKALLELKGSLNIPNRSVTVVRGRSGVGKSTLAKLIAGLIEAEVKPHSKFPIRSVFKLPQEIDIFDLDLEDNVRLGEQLDMVKMRLSLRKAGFNATELSELGQRRLGENGCNISVGQKQRIGIARMLYFSAEVMIFDEPTSSLDDKAKAIVLRTIKKLAQNHTVIVVAHDLQTARIADFTLRLN
jgi:ABC-type bacteriocin/lantibiotic exporter with double-glycine peptidase domain